LPLNDRFGRRFTLRIVTLVYIAGVLGQGLCSGNLSGFYASRFVTGIGVGATTVIPSVYISEVFTFKLLCDGTLLIFCVLVRFHLKLSEVF